MITDWLRKSHDKAKLRSCFRAAELIRIRTVKNNKYELTPTIHSIKYKPEYTEFVFTLPNGVNPNLIKKNDYVFQQYFGRSIVIKGDLKKFHMKVYRKGLSDKVKYNYENLASHVKDMKLPVICGMDINGQLIAYDITEDPNILIGGRPGWGKSAYLRMELTFLIQHFNPNELQLYLGDLKGSELVLFKSVEHVKQFEMDEDKIDVMLNKVTKELNKRKKLLNKYSVPHIHDLPDDEKVPYVLVVIDEFQDLKDHGGANDKIQKIAAKGRANGIYIILSTQRPSADITKGIIKASLNVSMAFRTKNKLNSNIILDQGSPDASKIMTKGRMIVSLNDYIEVQVPWIDSDKTKKIMKRYEREDLLKESEIQSEEPIKDIETTNSNEIENKLDGKGPLG
jgi:DNA segregation ATPase FtsK/SpoIIIE, S-DNA-T family